MEYGVVVPKFDVIGTHRAPLVLRRQNLAGFEHLGDEHGALAIWRWREEMKILPNGPADCARDSDVVLESRPAFRNGGLNQLLYGRPALGPKMTDIAFVPKLPVPS